MALPVINESPKYTLTIPSTKKKIFFRPFLVKEQKILLMALESQEQKTIVKAITDIIESCVIDKINVHNLATFDIEYMFTQIRSKSVGETSTIQVSCTECQHANEVVVNLEKIQVNIEKAPPLIQLNDKYALQLRFPRYQQLLDVMDNEDGLSISKVLFKLALSSLDKLLTDDEAINFDEESEEEKTKFLDNLTSEQFSKVMEFVQSLPKLTEEVKFNCEKCGHDNKLLLEGIDDFF